MKKVLLLLFIIPVVGFGQTIIHGSGTITIDSANVVIIGDTQLKNVTGITISSSPDTIPIIYLYSDTTVRIYSERDGRPVSVYDIGCKWDFGFIINGKYLDKNKIPLYKKFVVWYHKEL